ncbi:glutamate receptor ionotropic, kainate 3-like [Oratosquilla oratoria]|uniref:glutamate receptor ionotropic, kainate 3-like n=1 Tax=Oratosquilla oratoria TaxID=337810 RepID=UPI003F763F6D
MVRSPDRTWGLRQPNGSWTGMMGQLHRREVDMAVGPFGITEARAQAAAFSEPLYIIEQRIFYRRPEMGPDLAGFVKSFTPQVRASGSGRVIVLAWIWLTPYCVHLPTDVWLMVACITLVVAFALWLALFPMRGFLAGQRSSQGVSEEATSPKLQWRRPSDLYNGAHEVLQWCFGVLLAQSLRWRRSRGSCAWTLGGLWILVSLIFSTVYRSNLKAMLISPKSRTFARVTFEPSTTQVTIPFDGFDELIAQDDYNWRVAANSVTHQTLRDAPKDSFLGRAWLKAAGVVYNDFAKVLREMQAGHYALVIDAPTIMAFMNMDFSQVTKGTGITLRRLNKGLKSTSLFDIETLAIISQDRNAGRPQSITTTAINFH